MFDSVMIYLTAHARERYRERAGSPPHTRDREVWDAVRRSRPRTAEEWVRFRSASRLGLGKVRVWDARTGLGYVLFYFTPDAVRVVTVLSPEPVEQAQCD